MKAAGTCSAREHRFEKAVLAQPSVDTKVPKDGILRRNSMEMFISGNS